MKNSGIRVHVLGRYTGCIVYADDIFLLSPSRTSLQNMLNWCGVYANDNFLLFNVNKSVSIVFRRARHTAYSEPEFLLDGSMKLNSVDKITPLGHIISSVLADDLEAVLGRCKKILCISILYTWVSERDWVKSVR